MDQKVTFLAARAAPYLHMGLTNDSSFRAIDATMRAYLVRQPPTSLHKQVWGYKRSDNLQLPCLQPPTPPYNFQLYSWSPRSWWSCWSGEDMKLCTALWRLYFETCKWLHAPNLLLEEPFWSFTSNMSFCPLNQCHESVCVLQLVAACSALTWRLIWRALLPLETTSKNRSPHP